MRILTVRPPWAQLIIHHGKDVENRSTNIAGSYRGPVAIHAGLRPMRAGDRAWWAAEEAGMDCDIETGDELHPGHIIGVVDLVDVHVVQQSQAGTNVCFDTTTPTGDICSQWAGAYDEFPAYRGHHLVLANPRPLAEPIPYKGALGLRRFNDTVDAEILAQIGETE